MPLTQAEIEEIATKVADEVINQLQEVPELGLHIAEHEAMGGARIIDPVKAKDTNIACKCFSFEGEDYCWKPGYLGLISSKKNPEQMATCAIRVPAGAGAAERFSKLKKAIGQAHKEWEEEKGDLKKWWQKTAENLEKAGLSI
jgi:hypothetical protein